MNFAAIGDGTSLFVDANVFVYAFGPDPAFGPPSKVLLERIEQGDVRGHVVTRISIGCPVSLGTPRFDLDL